MGTRRRSVRGATADGGRDVIRVVCGAVIREGRVLVCQRSATKFPANVWELPGGKVEAGEEDALALMRELEEELAIQVEVGECLGSSVHDYGRKVVELVAYEATILAGEPEALEHQALTWLTATNLYSVEWAPADLPLLPSVQASLRKA